MGVKVVLQSEIPALEKGVITYCSVAEWASGKAPLQDTFVYHVVNAPYEENTEDLGQQQLFISPTDAQLSVRLSSMVADASTTPALENSTIPSPVTPRAKTSVPACLCPAVGGKLFGLYDSFLETNLKYDLKIALECLIKKPSDVILVLQDSSPVLHPMESTILTYLHDNGCTVSFLDKSDDLVIEEFESQPLEITHTSEKDTFLAWLSYLTILVNSRCEISLARTFNVPNRDLDMDAFGALKRVSRQKQMPMFQTALSHVTQIRLGGKGYQPNKKSELNQHIKGFSEYVDFIDKLKTHMEDYETSARVCIRKILATMEKEFCMHARTPEDREFVISVHKRFMDLLKTMCTLNVATASPKTPNSGGTMAGRGAFKTLQRMVTHLNVIHTLETLNSTEAIMGNVSVGHTPLINLFKSPMPAAIQVVVVEVPVQNKEKTPQKTVLNPVPNKRQDFSWAKTPETPFITDENSSMYITNQTSVEEESLSNCEPISVDIDDVEENSNSLQGTADLKTPIPKTKAAAKKKTGAKRKSIDVLAPVLDSGETPEPKKSSVETKENIVESKKVVVKPKAKSNLMNRNKNKVKELSKGQKTLSSFFGAK